MDNVDVFLEHFGVKGMHWGVRKKVNDTHERALQEVRARSKAPVYSYKDIHAVRNAQQTRRKAVALGVVGAVGLAKVAAEANRNPDKYRKAVEFAGKSFGVSMRLVSKMHKDSRIIFNQNGTTVFKPGSFSPGTFTNAGLQALGPGMRALGRG